MDTLQGHPPAHGVDPGKEGTGRARSPRPTWLENNKQDQGQRISSDRSWGLGPLQRDSRGHRKSAGFLEGRGGAAARFGAAAENRLQQTKEEQADCWGATAPVQRGAGGWLQRPSRAHTPTDGQTLHLFGRRAHGSSWQLRSGVKEKEEWTAVGLGREESCGQLRGVSQSER